MRQSCRCFFFFKQKTAYEMRISDWSSDVCSSDLLLRHGYTILRGAAPASLINGVAHDLEPRFAATPFCEGSFYGERTKRFGRLLIRSPLIGELVMHKAILDLAELALGNWCERIQLNLAQAIELHPGALAQLDRKSTRLNSSH